MIALTRYTWRMPAVTCVSVKAVIVAPVILHQRGPLAHHGPRNLKDWYPVMLWSPGASRFRITEPSLTASIELVSASLLPAPPVEDTCTLRVMPSSESARV